ncbi:MAG: methyltransferase [Pseudomonadota bacterium]
MSAPSQTSVARYYDRFTAWLTRDLTRFNIRQHAAIETSLGEIGRNHTVLEIGCGIGLTTRALARQAGFLVATDISARNVAIAQRLAGGPNVELLRHDIVEGSAEALQARAPFDRIVLLDVIEHIPSAHAPTVLARLKALLAPDGRLVLTFPTPEYLGLMRRTGREKLQIVDEDVHIAELAAQAGLALREFRRLDMWWTNQYGHAVLVRYEDLAVRRRRFRPWLELYLKRRRRAWRRGNEDLVAAIEDGGIVGDGLREDGQGEDGQSGGENSGDGAFWAADQEAWPDPVTGSDTARDAPSDDPPGSDGAPEPANGRPSG